MTIRGFAIASLSGLYLCLSSQAQTSPDDIFRAIRSNDLKALRALPKNGPEVNAAGRLKETPLHYAALYGSGESVRILLAAGADPNARNSQEATPLVYAAYDAAKTRMLVEAGAKVNVATHSGRTPLMVAACAASNAATVKYLIDKGAEVNAVDKEGDDALMAAAAFADLETVRVLLAHGGDVKHKDKASFTALLNAFQRLDDSRVKLLIDAGSDVNAANTAGPVVKTGPLALMQMTPLILAPAFAPSSVDLLVKAGGHINDKDARGVTPLIAAVADDRSDPVVVKKVIAAGADVNFRDPNGESALDWALKYGNPEIVAVLRQAGAKAGPVPQYPVRPADYHPANAADALNRASALMVTSGQGFFAASGCVGCHHQPMAARIYGAAHSAGVNSDERLKKLLLDGMVALRPFVQPNLPLLLDPGGDSDPLLYQLTALADIGEPASADTDLMLHRLAASQQPEGNWIASGGRSPLSEGSILLTSMALRAFKTYSWEARRAEFDERLARGRKWLESARPVTNQDRAERLMGLYYGGAGKDKVEQAGRELLGLQKSNGGWSQNAWLGPDAYATGMALRALYVTGSLKASDAAYQGGVDYLLGTQFPDGSWYVRSRSPKFQPYFQSGFPFNHDQWISSAATGWAAMALAPAAAGR